MKQQPLQIDSPVFNDLRQLIDQALLQAVSSAKINHAPQCTVTAKIGIELTGVAETGADDMPILADMVKIRWRVSASTPVKCNAAGEYNPRGGAQKVEYSPEREKYVVGPLTEQMSIDDDDKK